MKELVTIFITLILAQVSDNMIAKQHVQKKDGRITMLDALDQAGEGAGTVVILRQGVNNGDYGTVVFDVDRLTDKEESQEVSLTEAQALVEAFKMIVPSYPTNVRDGSAPEIARTSDVHHAKSHKKKLKPFKDPIYDKRLLDRRHWQRYKRRLRMKKRFEHWMDVRYPKVKHKMTEDSDTTETESEDDPEPVTVLRTHKQSRHKLLERERIEMLAHLLRSVLLKLYLEE